MVTTGRSVRFWKRLATRIQRERWSVRDLHLTPNARLLGRCAKPGRLEGACGGLLWYVKVWHRVLPKASAVVAPATGTRHPQASALLTAIKMPGQPGGCTGRGWQFHHRYEPGNTVIDGVAGSFIQPGPGPSTRLAWLAWLACLAPIPLAGGQDSGRSPRRRPRPRPGLGRWRAKSPCPQRLSI